MSILSFEDLLKKDTCVRKGFVDVDGVGKIELHELTIAEINATVTKAKVSKSEDEMSDFVTMQAARMIKGSEPTPEEIEALVGKLSPSQVTEIYRQGLNFNGQNIEAKEAIEKN